MLKCVVITRQYVPVAQLEERLPSKEKVAGSIPARDTNTEQEDFLEVN